MSNPIRVMVVDDSALMRNLISRILASSPEIEVATTAMNGQFAIEKLPRYDCDVIVLDLEMPVMNGIQFLTERKRLGITIPVIILSSIAMKGAQVTMEALSLGASDFILKPTGTESHTLQEVQNELVELVLSYGRRHKSLNRFTQKETQKEPKDEFKSVYKSVQVERFVETRPVAETALPKMKRSGTVEVIAIGISTGGPNALREILPKLDPEIPVPILIVQHMPAGFTFEFAKSLSKICPLPVKEATDGDILNSPRIFIAPGDRHMIVEQRPLAKIIRLSDSPPQNGHRPSVDVLYSSVATVYGNNCLAIIMTGMGKDGSREIGSIYKKGGLTIAQDEASCIVPGMPREAIKTGAIHEIVTLSGMADVINLYACEKTRGTFDSHLPVE